MPKDSSFASGSTPISVQSFSVRNERPAVGRLCNGWPFTVEIDNALLQPPVGESLLLTHKENSHFIT
ncbi:hypothetical protein IWX87_001604 [Polaromonas sp. CG_9.7]|jgi:hypothetical protein|nr:hypothetical protein [Polaromonas sp. CG_9.7]MBG6113852.1 hypothetical protein [Polaromonas sp. CG_9.2]MDH6183769.1 hypothetical protein [Polaromonas sp. CG_23.6]